MVGGEEPTTVGGRIRRLRLLRGLSQDHLAGPGLSASYLSRIESGARPAGDRLLADIAERLGTTVEHLRTGTDPAAARTADLQVRYAEIALRSGEPADALAQFLEVVGNDPDIGAELATRARLGAGQAREALGEMEPALEDFHDVAGSTEVGSKSWVDATLGLVRCYRLVGDLGKSIDCGEQAVASLRGRDDWPTADGVRVLATLEGAYFDRGDLHHARRLAAEAVELADRTGDRRAMASALWNTSIVNARFGAFGDAVAVAERAVGLLADLDAERDTVRVRVVLARLLRLDGQAPTALGQLERMRPAVDALGVVSDRAFWQNEYASVLLAVGRLDEAETEATAALALLGDEQRSHAADICLTLGRIARARRDTAGATRWLRRAALGFGSLGTSREAAGSWAELGAELDAAGKTADARDAYRAAVLALGIAPADRPADVRSPSV